MRRALDLLYLASGALAAVALLLIGVVILLQAASRWFGIGVQGLGEIAGYLMAAASFLAFGDTFRRGGHIRVLLVLDRLPPRARWLGEGLALSIATVLAAFFAFYAVRYTWVSWQLEMISEGSDGLPLFLPQIAMSFGALVLFLAVAQTLIEHVMGLAPRLPASDEPVARTE